MIGMLNSEGRYITVVCPMGHELEAQRYVEAIKNKTKKSYAKNYWRWMIRAVETKPESPGLSYMAAQAVRLELTRIASQKVYSEREILNHYRKSSKGFKSH